jgi:hypothetical protein
MHGTGVLGDIENEEEVLYFRKSKVDTARRDLF